MTQDSPAPSPSGPTVRAIIALWPTRAALAEDLSEDASDPVSVDRVNGWVKRGSIQSKYYGRILRAARRRALMLSSDDLVRAHDLGPQPATEEDAA